MNSTLRWARNVLRFYHLWLGRYRNDPTTIPAGCPPVILIGGWGNTPNTMSILSDRLARDGFAPFVFSRGGLLKDFGCSVEEMAGALKNFIEQICKERNASRVAIIGHSLGGLVARFLICRKGGGRLVHTVITLGAPHRGSPVARAASFTLLRWLSPCLMQAAPESQLLRELSANNIPPEVYCACLFSRHDYYCPPAYARLDVYKKADNITNVNVGNFGHLEYVIDKDTYRIILRHLNMGLRRAGLQPGPKNKK
jgi:triacylglycerol lipase